MPALEALDLRKEYVTPDGERLTVLDVPALRVALGEQVALRGRSGSGKTTLLHCIAGILSVDRGQVSVVGESMTACSEARRDVLRARHVGYVFQTFNLLQGYSALENVLLAMSFGRGADPAQARGLLERVGLKDRFHHRPAQLSVGQQQRVAVARALANRPELVLADEPTGSLDAEHADAALRLIREICSELGAALLLVSHDPAVLGGFERCLELADLNRAAHASPVPAHA